MKINGFDGLADQFRKVQRGMPQFEQKMCHLWADAVQNEAKEAIIGRTTPLEAVGEFPAWEPLLDETIRAKDRAGLGKGGDPYSMLYATGALYESIEKTVEPHRAAVGTDVEYAAVHEYGSVNVPPRPFLGPSAVRVSVRLYPKFQKMLTRHLEGKD